MVGFPTKKDYYPSFVFLVFFLVWALLKDLLGLVQCFLGFSTGKSKFCLRREDAGSGVI